MPTWSGPTSRGTDPVSAGGVAFVYLGLGYRKAKVRGQEVSTSVLEASENVGLGRDYVHTHTQLGSRIPRVASPVRAWLLARDEGRPGLWVLPKDSR